MLDNKHIEKMRSDDRILVIKQRPGEKTKDATGLIDYRLFKGGNRLHAMKDPITNLWMFRYEMGVLPEPLKQKFTGFQALFNHATTYFSKRGLEIVEVQDHHAETA